jgi:transposase
MDEKMGNATTLGRGARMSAKRKRDVVLRILRGEDLEMVSRDVGVIAARLSSWRDAFLAAGESVLKHRPGDERDEKITRLEAKLGQILMDNELLRDKIARMEAGRPLGRRRPRR